MKRKIISLLLAVTLTASFTGCGKEEAQDSSSNVKEETEEVDSQNNQAENNNVESDTIKNESSEENSGEASDETEGSQTSEEDNQESNPIEEPDSMDIDEEQIINERMEQWFDDLDWDVTEEEKETLYQEFCAERIPFEWGKGLYTLNRSGYYYDFEEKQAYLHFSEELQHEDEPRPEYLATSGLTGDNHIFVGGINENELYYMEYDATIHFIAKIDEGIRRIKAQKDYCFLKTTSGAIYRVHYLSGRVDYVTTLYPDASFYVYDSQSILYFDEEDLDVAFTGDENKSGEVNSSVIKCYDMEAAKCVEPPEELDVIRVIDGYDANDLLEKKELFEKFCINRQRYIPDDAQVRIFEYEIDENGNLMKWHKSEGREKAKIIEEGTYSLFTWNEYIYYMEGGTVKFRIDGIPADALVQLSGYGENIQIYGNAEYLFLVIDGVVDFYHIPSEKGESNVADIGIDSTNFRIYDNRSFLWDDVNGNTHYYDMDLDSEQPVPEDAVGM